MLEVEKVPERLAVLGGGVIGVEFASIFAHFGSQVTIVEMLPSLIPMEDKDASGALEKAFAKRGIQLALGVKATRVEETAEGVRLTYAGDDGAEQQVDADLLLVATGRGANVEGIGLEAAGVEFDRRHVPVDDHLRTNVPHIYAAGDVAGRWQLAHTAFREGEVAAENALGHESVVDERSTPRCVYTDPEVAAVGLTEAEARERHGDDVVVGTMPYAAIARAAMYGDRTGFVKVVGESRYGEFLGMVCVGTQATELVNIGVVGDRGRVDARDRRRRDRGAPDAGRGRQGGRAHGARAPAAHAAPAQAREGGGRELTPARSAQALRPTNVMVRVGESTAPAPPTFAPVMLTASTPFCMTRSRTQWPASRRTSVEIDWSVAPTSLALTHSDALRPDGVAMAAKNDSEARSSSQRTEAVMA